MIDLRKEREAKNLSQQDLADKVGVVRQTISEIERGTNMPSVRTAKAIAQILGFIWMEFYD